MTVAASTVSVDLGDGAAKTQVRPAQLARSCGRALSARRCVMTRRRGTGTGHLPGRCEHARHGRPASGASGAAPSCRSGPPDLRVPPVNSAISVGVSPSPRTPRPDHATCRARSRRGWIAPTVRRSDRRGPTWRHEEILRRAVGKPSTPVSSSAATSISVGVRRRVDLSIALTRPPHDRHQLASATGVKILSFVLQPTNNQRTTDLQERSS